MLRSNFSYYAPQSLAEALELLIKIERAAVLAGGTDLLVNLGQDWEKSETEAAGEADESLEFSSSGRKRESGEKTNKEHAFDKEDKTADKTADKTEVRTEVKNEVKSEVKIEVKSEVKNEARTEVKNEDNRENVWRAGVDPELIIDIKKISRLQKLSREEDYLHIGAAVTCSQFLENQEIAREFELLTSCVRVLGSRQIRNRATLVGNICTSSPGADLPPALLILGTKVEIARKAGSGDDGGGGAREAGESGEFEKSAFGDAEGVNEVGKGYSGKREAGDIDDSGIAIREVDLADFFTGVKQNLLQEGEMVTALKVSPPAPDSCSRYRRKTRVKGPDLSACGVAGYLSRERRELKFGFNAVAPTPRLLEAGESFFQPEVDVEAEISRFLARVAEVISPIDDVRSTAGYRHKMALKYTERIFQELWKQEVER